MSYAWINGFARGVGHTQAAIESGATVIVPDANQARDVRRRGGKAVVCSREALRGHTGPFVFDVTTVQRIVCEYEKQLSELEAENERLRRRDSWLSREMSEGQAIAAEEHQKLVNSECGRLKAERERDAALQAIRDLMPFVGEIRTISNPDMGGNHAAGITSHEHRSARRPAKWWGALSSAKARAWNAIGRCLECGAERRSGGLYCTDCALTVAPATVKHHESALSQREEEGRG